MSKTKSRILGQDLISESDVVTAYVHVHRIKKITKETLIGLLGDTYDFTGIIKDVNDLFHLALERFEHRDDTPLPNDEDPMIVDWSILTQNIGFFVYNAEHPDTIQVERYAYFFIRDIVSSDQRTLPEHINKEEFLQFIKSHLGGLSTDNDDMETTEIEE